MECEFHNCDLSLAKIDNTAFKDVSFFSCKLLGLHFTNCSKFLFSVHFNNCILNLSSFYKLDLRNSSFNDSNLTEVDFIEAILTNLKFNNCNFAGAIFQSTNIEKVDFRTSINISIDLEINKAKKTKFDLSETRGLLHKYDISIY